jgi:hypothetical protein
MSDSKEDMSKEDMETEEALKRMAEKDPAVREALIQLADEDPEKRKEVLTKLGEALGEDFRMRPWRHMSALEMDPENVRFLEDSPGIDSIFPYIYSYLFMLSVSLIVGFTVYFVTDLGPSNLKWWIIISSVFVAFQIWKWTLKLKIETMKKD